MSEIGRPAALGERPVRRNLRKSYPTTIPRYTGRNNSSWPGDHFRSPLQNWRAEVADRFVRKHSGHLIFSANKFSRGFLWRTHGAWLGDDGRVVVDIQAMIRDDKARRSAYRLGVTEFSRGSSATVNRIVALVAADRRIRA